MALDVHAEDAGGVLGDLCPGARELDPAGFATAADLHLGLHDDWVAEPLGRGFGLTHCVRHLSGRYGQAITREVLLALVLN